MRICDIVKERIGSVVKPLHTYVLVLAIDVQNATEPRFPSRTRRSEVQLEVKKDLQCFRSISDVRRHTSLFCAGSSVSYTRNLPHTRPLFERSRHVSGRLTTVKIPATTRPAGKVLQSSDPPEF